MDKLQRIAEIYNTVNKTDLHPVYHGPRPCGPQRTLWRSLLVMSRDNNAWLTTTERISSTKPTTEEDLDYFLTEAEAGLSKLIANKQEELDALISLQLNNKE
jgi:hypothetical protein